MIELTSLPWNDMEIESGIPSRFEAISKLFGEKLAIRAGNVSVNYRELNARVNGVAKHITSRIDSLAQGSLIPILLPQGIDFVVAMLAILKSGWAFVPLDPSAPATRNAQIIQDAECPFLLTNATSSVGVRAALPALRLFDIDEVEQNAEQSGPKILTSSGDLAYVLYTSGSTGSPKGVMQTHGHLLHNVRTHTEAFGITAADHQSLLYPCNVYGGVRDTFNALLNGASLHVLSVKNEELSFLPEWLEAEGITIYCSIATIFRRLLEWVEPARVFRSVRIVKLGGEAVYQRDVAGFRRHFDDQCKLSCGLASTETGAITQYFIGKDDARSVGLGFPVPGKDILLLAEDGSAVNDGETGEIVVHSRYVTRGYWKAQDLTANKIRQDPAQPGYYFYSTGDLARRLPDGSLLHAGRKDQLTKIRGNRIEIKEVEQAMLCIASIKDVVVGVTKDARGEEALIAYVEILSELEKIDPIALRNGLLDVLPSQMVPTYFVQVPRIPLLANGKKDRKAMSAIPPFRTSDAPPHPRGDFSSRILAICSEALCVERPDCARNFFELGADSLKLMTLHRKLSLEFNLKFPLTDLFRHPSIDMLSCYIEGLLSEHRAVGQRADSRQKDAERAPQNIGGHVKVAIVGIGCRFPQCQNVEEFWSHLLQGDTLLGEPSAEILKARHVPEHLLNNPAYIRTTSELSDIETFDYDFFGFTKAEAELLDPQFRLLLECAYEALEDAGETALRPDDTVGVFTSVGKANYIQDHLRNDPDFLAAFGERRALLFNDRTYSAAMVAYKLNLHGPAFNIDSACSSSLVAIHNAFRSLQSGDCTMALTGGCRVVTPNGIGYLHGEAGIESADGKVRPFDRDASGTIFGSGAGVILLKKLDDAIQDGNRIYAVIDGSAVSNDGSSRAGFSAPSVNGQARAIRRAQRDAGICASDIAYVEAHGTGTAIGDPIEVAALNEAFAGAGQDTCLLGAVKGNIGHTSTAAGVAGLIKAAMVVKTHLVPPTLNFNAPNPDVPFSSGPFRVSNCVERLTSPSGYAYAGVSSFGFGGTNAHVVLSSPPLPAAQIAAQADESLAAYVIPLSARTPDALRATITRLQDFVERNPEVSLASLSRTLATGRRLYAYRVAIVCQSRKELIEELSKLAARADYGSGAKSNLTFLFPGLGPQHLQMMVDLYNRFDVFRDAVDQCFALLEKWLDVDVKHLVYSQNVDDAKAIEIIRSSKYGQPCMYTFEYALAKLWLSFGLAPDSYLGHSLGEYVAATLSGVFSLEHALRVVVARGALMQDAPGGCMYAVASSHDMVGEIARAAGVAVAANNSPNQTIISGTKPEMMTAIEQLSLLGLSTRQFQASHAFHSDQMRHAVPELLRVLHDIEFHTPTTPFISNLTGTWIAAADAIDPDYWVNHMCRTVMFDKGLKTVAADRERVFLEVGPGQTLTTLIESDRPDFVTIVPSCKHHKNTANDIRVLYDAIAVCWSQGCDIDWRAVYAQSSAPLISLPTYPFERKRAWLGDGKQVHARAVEEPQDVPTFEKLGLDSAIMVQDVIVFLKQLWVRLLGCDEISDDGNFFELGGDSMLMVQVMRSITKRFEVKVEMKKLHRLLKLDELSAHVHELIENRTQNRVMPR